MYKYSAYSLTFQLPFPCSTLLPARDDALPDFIATEGAVPLRLSNALLTNQRWDAAPRQFLWRGGPKSGRFLVRNGETAVLQRNPGFVENVFSRQFASGILPAILRQRGNLLLHASSATTPNGAIAVSGVSGSGKSTSLASILSSGGQMLTDDVTVITFDKDGRPVVQPGLPYLYLCDDAVKAMQMKPNELTIPNSRLKSLISIENKMAPSPALLRRLYILRKSDCSRVILKLLKGHERFEAVQESIYGPMFPEEHPAQFMSIASIMDHVDIYSLERPANIWTANEVSAALTQD